MSDLPVHHRALFWNNLSLTTPSNWEVVVQNKKHLLFEDDMSPLLEIRWEFIPHKSHLKAVSKFISQAQNQLQCQLLETEVPGFLQKKWKDYQIFCYSQKPRNGPTLVLLYCNTCLHLIMVQVLGTTPFENICSQIGNLTCHSGNSAKKWSIQDFQVKIPKCYGLESYSFKPGFTRIHFKHKKSMLNICRFSAASKRLQQQTYTEMLAALMGEEKYRDIHLLDDQCVQFQQNPTILRQIFLRLQKKRPFRLARLWHNPHTDRIMAVTVEDTTPIDGNLFEDICGSYETF